MSANIPINITGIEPEHQQPSKTYRLDFDGKRILSAGSVDRLEAVNQFIKKALLTPRFKCLVYDNQYGSEIKNTIIAGDVSTEYIEAEMPRIVKDCLMSDGRVLDVYDFSFSFDRERAYIKFKADTVFGTIEFKEAV